MKQLMYTIALICLGLSLPALVIETGHFGYNDGSQRNFKQGGWNQASTDLSECSAKVWSFSLPVTGFVNNHYSHISGATGYPTANIACKYTQYINGINDSGTLYYQNNGTDILSLGYTAAPNLVWNPPIPTGLPHELAKTWQGTHSYTYGSYSVSGKVISQGTVSLPLGTFDALCVRYHYSTTNFSYYCYQWETIQYGIVAYALTLNGGMLYVLEQATPNVTAADDLCAQAPLALRLYPNPAREGFWIKAPTQETVGLRIGIYDLKGRKLLDMESSQSGEADGSIRIDLSDKHLATGVYIIEVKGETKTYSGRLLILK